MPEEQAPPVVAVVVASDPGPWFEECLAALGAQDYPNLDVLVVDVASAEGLTARVANVLPGAFLRRLDEQHGFAAGANEALGAVEGATHLVICHDDVAPAPDAVRRLVEEAFRSNAGIVGPKFVEWDAPERLLQVGLGVGRFGTPIPRVEPGELDQAQHDEVREVFAVSGGFTLVRADLFQALGGFDPEIEQFGEDIDLCWRAQVAGARVVVAPSATVRHRQATEAGERPSGDRLSLQRRHEVRLALKNYDNPRRLIVTTQLVLASIGEVVVGLATTDRGRVHRVTEAWRWNLGHRGSLRTARAAVREARHQPDRVVVALQSRRTKHAVQREPDASDGEPRREADRWRELPSGNRSVWSRSTPATRTSVVAIVVAVIAGFGLRGLVFGRLPLIGQLVGFPSPSVLLSHFFGGWQDAGWQLTGPGPTAFGLVGAVGTLLFDSTSLIDKLLLFGSIATGVLGIYRLLGPLGSRRAQLAATIAYLGFPLVWNDVAAGDLTALVTYAAMPYVLGRLARASGLAPFSVDGSEPKRGWRAVAPEIWPFGLLLAVVAALSPTTIVAIGAVLVGLLVGSLVTGGLGGLARAALVTAGALVVAVACLLPWSITYLQPGARWSVLGGAVGGPATRSGIAKMMRFAVGPIGGGWLGWGLVLAAGYVLFVAQGPRLAWAGRWWIAAMVTVAIAYAGSVGWLGAGGGATLVLLTPAACCLAAAVGLGVASFETDLARSRFGWRQSASAVAVCLLAAGLLPTVVSMGSGRSGLPVIGYDQVLGWTAPRRTTGAYQVLWLGEPGSIPTPAWQLRRGVAYAVSVNGLPDGQRVWPSPNPGLGNQVAADIRAAEEGRTVRLGAELAAAGVRYVLVPSAAAPTLPGIQSATRARPAPTLVDALRSQLDLRELPTEGGVLAFEDTAWPLAGSTTELAPALVTAPAGTPAALRTLGVVVGLSVWAAALFEGFRRRRRRRSRADRHQQPDPVPDEVTDPPPDEVTAERDAELAESLPPTTEGPQL